MPARASPHSFLSSGGLGRGSGGRKRRSETGEGTRDLGWLAAPEVLGEAGSEGAEPGSEEGRGFMRRPRERWGRFALRAT